MAKEKSSIGMKAKNRISNAVIYVILTAMSIVWLAPFVCIVLQSFRVEKTGQVGYVIPKQWGLQNYINLFNPELCDFSIWFKNTLIISLCVAVINTFMILCMSYTLSRFRFKMRKPLMQFMLVIGLFPGILGMLILYWILKDLGLTQENAVPGLILVYTASSGMGYYITKGFFDTIPMSLDEAARIDGANRLQVFIKVIMPLAKPIVIYTVLTAFMGPWADFLFARFISFGNPKGMNVAVGLWSWLSRDQIGSRYTMFCAGGVLIAIPITVLFLCLQRYYVEGVTGGSVKG
ncbi:MAG: sugar ABC transporter permease [Lachnospiraceae bacterium]|nr:sugar ABC transporter permease [Lachnospiraceae bacterium]